MQVLEQQKKQDLGIFYTDQRIVDFIYDILNIWKAKEEKESGRWESRGHFPSVIDPAVGEGIFLKSALEKGFTIPRYVFGVDIDAKAKERWVEINLLKSFGSQAELDNHFFHQNGLLPLNETKVLPYKRGGLNEFDVVVGNPPYGGLGLKGLLDLIEYVADKGRNLSIAYKAEQGAMFSANKQISYEKKNIELDGNKIEELLSMSYVLKHNYDIWRKGENKIIRQTLKDSCEIINQVKVCDSHLLDKKDYKRLESFPVEILFVERFIKLAKPGGWVAIVIPDGILTNSNSHYVREFIGDKTKVEAIISLPRDAFKNVGTSAKTSILFLQKYSGQEEKQQDYPVFLASVNSLDEKNFNLVKDSYKNYYNKAMNNKNLVQKTTDENNQEIVTVRVDKTLKDMMEEKPSGRWSPDYWHPDFDDITAVLETSRWEIKILGDFIPQGVEWITYGSTKPRQWSERGEGIKYIKPGNVKFTGLDYRNIFWTPEGGNLDRPNYRVNIDDLIVNKSGVGTWGRGIVLTKNYGKMVVSQDTMRIRLRGISPYYVAIYLWSNLGHRQQERNFVGVGATHIDFDELRTIKIPLIPDKVQRHIEFEYKKMSEYHDKAMEPNNNDEAGYRENIEISNKILKDLIVKTEAVIRGEREDVI